MTFEFAHVNFARSVFGAKREPFDFNPDVEEALDERFHDHELSYPSLHRPARPEGLSAFLPFGLMRALRVPYIRNPLKFLLRNIVFWRPGDIGERAARFAAVGGQATQSDIFDIVSAYYPSGTRFVVLPMDMAFMKRGAPPVDLPEQHDELAALAKAKGGVVIPFAAIDPRRPKALDELKRCKDMGFKGVKLYPLLGYRPDDEILMKHIYP